MARHFSFSKSRKCCDLGQRLELSSGRRLAVEKVIGERAQIALVVPTVVLLGENALESLAVEVQPLITRTVQGPWNIREAFGIDFLNLLLHLRLAVLELNTGQRPLEIRAVDDLAHEV